MKLIIATKNDSKIKEIKEVLGSTFDLKTYKNFSDWPDVEETGNTFEENAHLKAQTLAKKYNATALADDSGLIVDSLNNEPGVYSSRYAGKEASDEQNINKLLENLKNKNDRSAAFITAIVFIDDNDKEIVSYGKVSGQIIAEPKGSNGFGYDPVFVPEGFDKTFGQMSAEEKNSLSHRGQALRNLKVSLQSKGYLK